MSVASTNGSSITTRDFLSDGGVVRNADNNAGYDILVGAPQPSAPVPQYEIDYSAKDQSFGITIYAEPLGQARTAAEQDLNSRLGITKEQMCSLNYVLATGPGVNELYAGKNLEFSFCPGATALPN